MLSIFANRAPMALLTLAGVAVLVFVLLRIVPGDPIAMMISPGATPADIAALKAHYGWRRRLRSNFGSGFVGLSPAISVRPSLCMCL